MEAGTVPIRLSQTPVELAWDDARELLRRLDLAGGTSAAAAAAIRKRDPTGALLTHAQRVAVWNVIHDWIGEAGVEGLGTVNRLRDAIVIETPEIGRPKP